MGFLNPQLDLEEFILCRTSQEQVLPAFILYIALLWRPGCELPFQGGPGAFEGVGNEELPHHPRILVSEQFSGWVVFFWFLLITDIAVGLLKTTAHDAEARGW